MIPQSENSTLIEDTFPEEPQLSEESRCGQDQRALEVYQRILQRLQTQPQEYAIKTNESDLMKQIWIASFTGRPIQYHC
ncbi:hypothetical protein KR009_006016 [Drosophila setifemur]|nr:hypothetical protein KR009_006016 [Drosophila setifemur]